MARFEINILGCGAATPSLRHLPACQVIDYRDRLLMVDAGEGAQLSMRRQRLKYSRLTDIFISHLHGDHFLGVLGLISTMSLHEKSGTVTIHTFEQGAELLQTIFKTILRDPSFDLRYNIIDPHKGGLVLDDKNFTVTAFPLYHKIDCVGYRFDEKPKLRHIKGDMAAFHKIPHYRIPEIKAGADFVTDDGRIIPNAVLTTDADPSVSYAYASDTAFNPAVAEAVRGVDLLYHEATYCDDFLAKAAERGHSTASQAAEIARMAGVGQLLLGHFSKTNIDETPLLEQARAIFPNTLLASEGMKIELLP